MNPRDRPIETDRAGFDRLPRLLTYSRCPLCRLEHASGSVPLDNGYVYASWRRSGGLIGLECSVPPGTMAIVRLPVGTYGVKGPSSDAAVVLSAADGDTEAQPATRDFLVHTGTWTFTPA